MSIVERSEKELDYDDSTVTNKWRWDWLEKRVTFNPLEKFRKLQSWNGGDVTMNVIDHIRKLTTSGLARCISCNCDIAYSERGVHTLLNHLQTYKHFVAVNSLKKNQSLRGALLPRS